MAEVAHKRIPFLPLQMAFTHGRPAAALEYVVKRRARVTVRASFFFGFEKLNLARHGGIRKSAGGGIDVAQQPAIIGIAVTIAHRLQSVVGVLPSVAKRHSSSIGLICLGGPRESEAAQ